MDAEKLLKEALRLSPEERAAIAGELIQSLDQDIDEGAEAAWAEEIHRGVRLIEAGQATTVSWPEARRRLRLAAGRDTGA